MWFASNALFLQKWLPYENWMILLMWIVCAVCILYKHRRFVFPRRMFLCGEVWWASSFANKQYRYFFSRPLLPYNWKMYLNISKRTDANIYQTYFIYAQFDTQNEKILLSLPLLTEFLDMTSSIGKRKERETKK